jgi:predicted nuclease with TOPRIM domain
MTKNGKSPTRPVTEEGMVELLADFYDDFLGPKFLEAQKERQEIRKDVENLQSDMTFVKRDIKEMKADQSTTVDIKEFKMLERKVNRYHPTN